MKLPRHPFAVSGRIEACWLFVHRAPAETVRALLPRSLDPVTHGGFAFWNVVVCRLGAMRPALLPAACGIGYWHVGYRLLARAPRERIEGLYFVGSDCDRRLVTWAGNFVTDFRFRSASIRISESARTVEGVVESAGGAARFSIDRMAAPQLSEGSPFATLHEAARALEYQPRALSPMNDGGMMEVRVRRDPEKWHWRNVAATEAAWPVPELSTAPLELCYEVEPIDYLWERGRRVHVAACV